MGTQFTEIHIIHMALGFCQVGPAEQKRFVEIFRQAVAWPPVMACYGLDALDSLPGMLKSRTQAVSG